MKTAKLYSGDQIFNNYSSIKIILIIIVIIPTAISVYLRVLANVSNNVCEAFKAK